MNQIYNENDFKYVIQDISSTQIGSRFTYEDILMNERVPYKFQSIINIYILREMKHENPENEFPEKTEIGRHVLSIKPGSLIYNTYKRLKLKVRFCFPNNKGEFTVKQLSFEQFYDFIESNSKDNSLYKESIYIQDVTISNLALMTFTV